MRENVEFRIFQDHYDLLSKPNGAIYNGAAYVIKVFTDDPLYQEIGRLDKFVREKYNRPFYGYSEIRRQYTQAELESALLFRVLIKPAFEPVGESCGTVYDESVACEICGANRKQIGPLKLKSGSIPKKDIARTIAGEVVVSEKFVNLYKKYGLKGASFNHVLFQKATSNYYQLTTFVEVNLSEKIVVGRNPFNLSTEPSEAGEFTIPGGYVIKTERVVFKCPKGHLVGPRLLSEAFIINTHLIEEFDFMASKEKIGGKQGVLYPETIYMCSPLFRKIIIREKLTGFDFEVANIE